MYLIVALALLATPADAVDAIRSGDLGRLVAMLDAGLSVDATGGKFNEALLNHAALYGQAEITALLIERGANVKLMTARNTVTPLMRASNRCQEKIVALLLAAGADPNQQSGNAYTQPALGQAVGSDAFSEKWAARGSCKKTVERLLDAGADINRRGDGDGHSALTLSINYPDKPEIPRLLLKRGADPNLLSFGKTPLHAAIEAIPIYSNFDKKRHAPQVDAAINLIRILIAGGADKGSQSTGKSLATIAKEKFSAGDVTERNRGRKGAAERAEFFRRKLNEVLALLK